MDQYYINLVKRAYWEGYYHGHDDAIEEHEFDIEGHGRIVTLNLYY